MVSTNGSGKQEKMDNIRPKRTYVTKEQKRAGCINDKHAVIIDRNTVVWIDDPSREEEVRKAYYEHIHGKPRGEDAFEFVDDTKPKNKENEKE